MQFKTLLRFTIISGLCAPISGISSEVKPRVEEILAQYESHVPSLSPEEWNLVQKKYYELKKQVSVGDSALGGAIMGAFLPTIALAQVINLRTPHSGNLGDAIADRLGGLLAFAFTWPLDLVTLVPGAVIGGSAGALYGTGQLITQQFTPNEKKLLQNLLVTVYADSVERHQKLMNLSSTPDHLDQAVLEAVYSHVENKLPPTSGSKVMAADVMDYKKQDETTDLKILLAHRFMNSALTTDPFVKYSLTSENYATLFALIPPKVEDPDLHKELCLATLYTLLSAHPGTVSLKLFKWALD